MKSLGITTCTWFSADGPPDLMGPYLVAVDSGGGKRTVMPGRYVIRKQSWRARGCSARVVAWAYYPCYPQAPANPRHRSTSRASR